MTLITITGIAIALAMDVFAVSIAAGAALGKLSARQTFRMSFHFGLFQALMPVIGWLAGISVVRLIEAYDHWVAFGLLAFIGSRMIYESFSQKDEFETSGDPTRGLTLILLSVATSIDALAVGLSFAMLKISIWLPCLIIGLVSSGMSILGIRLGNRVGAKFGNRAIFAGGAVLIGIGIKILIKDIF